MASEHSGAIGTLAETLVARWLEEQGWQILQRRWHCRWGELDLVVSSRREVLLAFVEVKARSRGNWDADGLLALTAQKQKKLWQAAELFLSEHLDLAELPCRFDLALVSARSPQKTALSQIPLDIAIPSAIRVGQPVAIAGYSLTLQQYIEAAFGA